jgi:hypothetical protein
VRYLKSEVREAQGTIYVQSWAEEPTRLYVRLFHWVHAPIWYGHTGLPCCKRAREVRPVDAAQEGACVLDDFRHAIGKQRRGELWLLFRALPYQLNDAIDHDERLITSSLSAAGCREDLERHFGSVVVDRFQCMK